MGFSSWLFNLTEGVGIAFDAIRSNKVRAALTILGVAVGVFVVVTLSAAVHGINASVAKDLESAGPTSFFVFRRPVSLSEICDGTENTCPSRRNPPITLTEVAAVARLPEVKAVTSHIGWSGSFKYKDKEISSGGLDAYSAGWLLADGGDIVSVHISAAISGTYESAMQARERLQSEGKGGERIEIVDSRTAAGGMALVLFAAGNAVYQGASAKEAAAKIRTVMEGVFPLDVPLVVDVGWGATWAEAH